MRAVAPATGGGGGQASAWVIPGVAAAALVAGGALWVAGGLASMLAGAGWRSAPLEAPFGLPLLIGVLRDGTRPAWPAADPHLVTGLAATLAALVLLPAGLLVLRRVLNAPAADDPGRSLARGVHLQAMLGRPAATRALRLRPSLAGTKARDLPAGDVGLLLGRLGTTPRSAELFSSWEDVAVAIMAPRSGKTTTLAVPITLAAPGAVVLTSNKTEGWQETAALRAAQTGQTVWTFDPQRIAHAEQTWWWNPLAGLTTVAEANRLAGHFVATVQDDRRDIWGPAAKELLATLLLAAAAGGRSLVEVYGWLANEATPVPGGLLREHGYDLLARTLRGTQDSPPETRGSVYFTARAATACLRDDQITAWVTPPATSSVNSANTSEGAVGTHHPGGQSGPLVEFRPDDFPTSRQTLYLLSKDEGGSAGPLVAALTDRVLRCGVAAAEQRGGRLDPPMVLVLDEAANICRISDLPALYSHLGSRGIVPLTILQSYSQAVGVWGETGTKALWGAATIKLIGAGIDDPSFAEDLSRLVGEHDVRTVSRSTGGGRGGSGGGVSRTHATRQQRILPASAIRELPRGRALLLATGSKPALISLQPWYTGPRADQITAAQSAALAGITARAHRPAPASR